MRSAGSSPAVTTAAHRRELLPDGVRRAGRRPGCGRANGRAGPLDQPPRGVRLAAALGPVVDAGPGRRRRAGRDACRRRPACVPVVGAVASTAVPPGNSAPSLRIGDEAGPESERRGAAPSSEAARPRRRRRASSRRRRTAPRARRRSSRRSGRRRHEHPRRRRRRRSSGTAPRRRRGPARRRRRGASVTVLSRRRARRRSRRTARRSGRRPPRCAAPRGSTAPRRPAS